MPSGPEELKIVTSLDPIRDSIKNIENAWNDAADRFGEGFRLSPEKQEELHWVCYNANRRLESVVDVWGDRITESQDKCYPVPSGPFDLILKLYTELYDYAQVGPLSNETDFDKQLWRIQRAKDQAEVLIMMWGVLVQRIRCRYFNLHLTEVRMTGMRYALEEARRTGLYDLLVKFSMGLPSRWAMLHPRAVAALEDEARQFFERGSTERFDRLKKDISQSEANALAVAERKRKPYPDIGSTFVKIGELLAASNTSGSGQSSPRHAQHSEHSLATISPRKRAIYEQFSAL